MTRYNVAYDTLEGTKFYTIEDTDLAKAIEMLAKFKARYLNEDGSPKEYPNRKGFYDISNARIVMTTDGIYYHSMH